MTSMPTLDEVGQRFGFDLAEARRRFRANLEIGDCAAFWEDALASSVRTRAPGRCGRLRMEPSLPAGGEYADGSGRRDVVERRSRRGVTGDPAIVPLPPGPVRP